MELLRESLYKNYRFIDMDCSVSLLPTTSSRLMMQRKEMYFPCLKEYKIAGEQIQIQFCGGQFFLQQVVLQEHVESHLQSLPHLQAPGMIFDTSINTVQFVIFAE